MVDKILDTLARGLSIDIRYAIKGVSLLTAGQVVSSSASFVLALAFANLLPPETYGVYRYVLAVGALLAIPTLSGMNNALIQAIAAKKGGTLALAFTTKLQYGLLGSLAGLTGSVYYLLNDNTTLAACFAIIAVTIPAMEAFKLFDSVLQGRQDFRRSVIIDSILQVTVAGVMVAAIMLTQSVIVAVGVYFFLWTAGRGAAWLYVTHFLPNKSDGVDPRTIRFGIHLSVMGAVSMVAQYIDQILLFQHIGAAELALYSIAIAIPEQFRSVLKGVFSLLLPRYSTQSEASIRATIWKKALLLSGATVAMTIGYIVLIPYALPLLFPQYIDAVWYSQLFALSFITTVAGLFVTALQAQQKTQELYVLNVIQPVAQIVFAVVGVIYFGVFGAIVARLASRIAVLVTSVVLYQRTRTA